MTRDTTIAARVTHDLRTDLEAAQALAGDHDLSDTIRRLLRTAVDLELAGQPPAPGGLSRPTSGLIGSAATNTTGLSNLDAQPRSHRHGPATEHAAAQFTWPRAGTGRRALLAELELRVDGITSDEAVQRCGYSAQRRLHDLKAGGWVQVALDEHGQPRRRKTRRGAFADVYILTPAAIIELVNDRVRRQRDAA